MSGNFNVFPNLNVMALTFLGFSTVCDGNLSEFWACDWFSWVAIYPIWFVKLWIEALVSCWNYIFWMVIILTNSSNEVEEEGAGVAAGAGVGTCGTRAACASVALCCGGGCTFWNCWFCCCWLPWFPHLKLGWFLHPRLYLFVDKSWWFCCWQMH